MLPLEHRKQGADKVQIAATADLSVIAAGYRDDFERDLRLPVSASSSDLLRVYLQDTSLLIRGLCPLVAW